MDFKQLEKAAESLQDKLRQDETAPDLLDQFLSREQGSHRYYTEPYKSQSLGPLIEYGEFIPLPKRIMDQCTQIECASFMGIIPELNRVWVTVDNKLFLWKYTESVGGGDGSVVDNCDVFDGLNEVIVSVSLSAPRPGVFMDTVKYLLVVASPVEVVLLAVTADASLNNVAIVPTKYRMGSDNVAMVKVVGSQSGRIFMAGNDGNVYELDYGSAESVWTGLVDGDGANGHKCRKINHFAWNWRLVNVLPPFLQGLAGGEEDGLVDIAVDNVRHVVYAVTGKGKLSAFYMGASGSEMHLFQPSFPLLDAVRQYCGSYNAPEGCPRPESFADGTQCVVLSLAVLSPVESRRAHAVVTLQNGIRVYLTLRTSGGGHFSTAPTPRAPSSSFSPPSDLQVVYVRSPPPQAVLRSSARSGTGPTTAPSGAGASGGTEGENGCVPSFIPAQALRLSAALSTQAVTLLALDKQQHPDELVALFEDLVSRSQVSFGLAPTHTPPSMREGVCIAMDETRSGGKIYDLQEDVTAIHTETAAQLRALYAFSATAPNGTLREVSHLHDASARSLSEASAAAAARTAAGLAAWLDAPATVAGSTPSSEVPVVSGGRALHAAGKNAGRGYNAFDASNVARLTELSWQHVPCTSVSLRRHFLVLTNQGIHILRKLRPADVLYRQLSQVSASADDSCRQFFLSFGPLESSAMCVALACGLPCDAGSMAAPSVGQVTAWKPLESVQMRAMSLMLAQTQGPQFKNPNAGLSAANGAALQDSRLVISSTATHELVHSSAHNALYLVCSRILRPIWLRNVVDKDGMKLTSTWTPAVIADIRGPLAELRQLLKSFFATAVLGSKVAQDQGGAKHLLDRAPEDLMTGQMRQLAQAGVSADRQIQMRARAIEDASIQALYSLVAKALQALSFIDILSSSGARVPWASLGQVSFRSLVVSSRAHEGVKRLVNAVISDLTGGNARSAAARHVVEALSRECSYYFTPGDRCLYEVNLLLPELRKRIEHLSSGTGLAGLEGAGLLADVQKCVQLLHGAARYWRTLESVQGEQAELWKQCSALIELAELGREGAVDLCLIAAANFAVDGALPLSSMANESGVLPSDGASLWESQLYADGGPVLDELNRRAAEEACFQCLVQHIMTVGADVRRLGAGLVPSTAGTPSGSNPLQEALQGMRRMVVRALSKCATPAFTGILGDRLLREHEDVLLSVQSPSVELFLTSKDPLLLYKYYEQHGECLKATALMSALARDEADCAIATRVGYLQRAVASAERAGAVARGTEEAQMAAELLLDLKDTLEIAGYQLEAAQQLSEQLRAYGAVTAAARARYSEGQRRSLDLLERAVQKVQSKLVPITDLFHELCMPYKLWDISLLILHASKHDDEELIARLWRSFIYRLVPESGASEDGQAFLRLKRDCSKVEVDKRRQLAEVPFEQSEAWLPALQSHLVRLAQQICGGLDQQLPHSRASGNNALVEVPAFPSALVLEELEEIAATLAVCGGEELEVAAAAAGESKGGAISGERGWTVRCFADIGFSFGTVVELLVATLDQWQGKAPEKLLHLLWSTTYALLQWTRRAAELSARNESSTRQLMQAARSGRVASWLEKLRRQLSTLGARRVSADSQLLIVEMGKEVAEIARRVSELTVA